MEETPGVPCWSRFLSMEAAMGDFLDPCSKGDFRFLPFLEAMYELMLLVCSGILLWVDGCFANREEMVDRGCFGAKGMGSFANSCTLRFIMTAFLGMTAQWARATVLSCSVCWGCYLAWG